MTSFGERKCHTIVLSVDAENGKCQHQQQGDEPPYYGNDECTEMYQCATREDACARQQMRNLLACVGAVEAKMMKHRWPNSRFV